jgi:hypothetical protein
VAIIVWCKPFRNIDIPVWENPYQLGVNNIATCLVGEGIDVDGKFVRRTGNTILIR